MQPKLRFEEIVRTGLALRGWRSVEYEDLHFQIMTFDGFVAF